MQQQALKTCACFELCSHRAAAAAPWVDVSQAAVLCSCRYHAAAEARAMVEKELGAPIDELFSEFSAKPIAAASLAQVRASRGCRQGRGRAPAACAGLVHGTPHPLQLSFLTMTLCQIFACCMCPSPHHGSHVGRVKAALFDSLAAVVVQPTGLLCARACHWPACRCQGAAAWRPVHDQQGPVCHAQGGGCVRAAGEALHSTDDRLPAAAEHLC